MVYRGHIGPPLGQPGDKGFTELGPAIGFIKELDQCCYAFGPDLLSALGSTA